MDEGWMDDGYRRGHSSPPARTGDEQPSASRTRPPLPYGAGVLCGNSASPVGYILTYV